MTLTIPARRIAITLTLIALFLCLFSIALKTYEYSLPLNHSNYFLFNLSLLFNVNREQNIPTWFSSFLLFTAALLLLVIAYAHRQKQDRYSRRWFVLGLIFFYLSIDESAYIHEMFTEPLQIALNTQGYLYFAWVLLGIAFVGIVGLAYARFVWKLPPQTRWRFILAGAIYVGGALGVEVISANEWFKADGTSLLFSAIGTVEEFMEMTGVIVFIYALLLYLADYAPDLRLAVARPTV
jgi:hypothetical protein